jgi:hypothetical protein
VPEPVGGEVEALALDAPDALHQLPVVGRREDLDGQQRQPGEPRPRLPPHDHQVRLGGGGHEAVGGEPPLDARHDRVTARQVPVERPEELGLGDPVVQRRGR